MIELIKGDCLIEMQNIADKSIDLTVTSPPYDNLRTYNGNNALWGEHVWKGVIEQLFRITKVGGVVVWVVGDATINGSETGTSFKQALYFMQCGFNVETMIWEKTGSGCLGSNKFYGQNFEFMFILTKGKPKTTNLICDRKNKKPAGTKTTTNGGIDKNGNFKSRNIITTEYGNRNNIWRFDTQKNSEHPAPFPEQLANDHIISWSNEGDVVFDPFMGSGTTGKMAKLNNRNFIGIEMDDKYFEIAKKRIADAKPDLKLEL